MNKLLLLKKYLSAKTCAVLYALMMLVFTSCQDDDTPIGSVNTKTSFTIAVIPDAQNMTDFKHQKSKGFALDCSELFIQQSFIGIKMW